MSDAPPDKATLKRPAADLDWTEAHEPLSRRFGDVYFSRDDGLAETRAVFLDGCGLPEAWRGHRHFTVAELGLGTGLNILAVLDLWRRHREPDARLSLFSIEAYPMTAQEAARALTAWPELADLTDLLLSRWPVWTPGFHRIDLPEMNAVLDVAIGDAAWALAEWRGQADAWFLDGFSPALNPGMWSDAVLDGVAMRSAAGARLATFTVAGAVRRGLSERGFHVEKRPGHGRKRERLEARLKSGDSLETADPEGLLPSVAVVGAGIAGACVVRALMAGGLSPVVVEEVVAGAGASGFPTALVTPRFDVGDAGIAALHAQALARAGSLYRAVNGAVAAQGVLQLEQTPRDATRFDKIAAQSLWPEGAMQRLTPDEASDRLGEPVAIGGLWMAQALAIRPAPVLEYCLAGATRVTGRVVDIQMSETGWRTLDAEGRVLSDTRVLVLTSGWGNSALASHVVPDLGLRPVRGQADWIEDADLSVPPTAWGGYVVPTGDGILFGATHDRDQTEVDVRPDDSARNRATLAQRLGQTALVVGDRPSQARAAVRATTPDRLPFCGSVGTHSSLFILGGLGSRGFCLAPLLGEDLAARILGRTSPLPAGLAARLALDR